MSDTTSTLGIYQALRQRLLTFSPLTGNPVADTLGRDASGPGVDGRLYWDQAPDNVTTAAQATWGVLALKNRRRDAEQAERMVAELEVMLFGRPRDTKLTLEAAADVCEQAMLRYVDASSGVLGCWGGLRNAMPPFVSPADRDVAQIQLTFSLVLWPAYLTQYHDQP